MTETMSAMPAKDPSLPGTPEHLGGHHSYTNMDRVTLGHLVGRFGIRSMLDVGCGTGGMVDYASSIGLEACGIDGDPHMARRGVVTHDYTRGPYEPPHNVDLVWSVEFVEHVEREYVPNFLATFAAGRVLMMTHAQPGQGGHHHVHLREDGYWIGRLERDGWELDYTTTGWVRVHSPVVPYVKCNGLVFTR